MFPVMFEKSFGLKFVTTKNDLIMYFGLSWRGTERGIERKYNLESISSSTLLSPLLLEGGLFLAKML